MTNKPTWLDTDASDVPFQKQPKPSGFATVVRRSGTPKIVCKGSNNGPVVQLNLRIPYEQAKRLKEFTEGPHTNAIVAIMIDLMDQLEANHEQLHIELN